MCTQVKIRAVDAVLPSELIRQAQANEKTMMAAAILVVNLIGETISFVEQKQPKGLDAYPGDRICQGRVIILPELFEKPEVCQELQLLAEKIKAQQQVLKKRKQLQNCSPAEFFEKEIASLEISNDVHYLMDCRLLMVTRATHYIEPSGIVQSRADHGNLSKLSPDIDRVERFGSNFREQITQNACMRVSAQTMARLQETSRRMKIPELLQRMVGEVVVYKPENFPPKSFGCQFFTMQLALTHLLERKMALAIRKIVPSDKPHSFIFFKAAEKDFELNEQLPKTSYVAIFHAVVPSEENLIAKIKEIGFIELTLRYAAQENPFQHTSSIDDVKDPEARRVLEEYREKAAKSGCLKGSHPLLLLHHVYCNTIQEEVK
jgi:hypothetical protein